ncbi:biopolymer transporter ExbD [Conchiformibius steedae DSM 2580]|uniref:Biopolymer transporter ExbD n=1 Tax=Conchiformibius steedae DSM 2580 TaxID=1121352 RepID=A0AAE9HX48_9NEIS|nr:biopolymer transporter ExbD [Conchiformibius steedae]QMT33336.1 biopolymer transporter ExbD [Conchiformibius steedae]URD67980.1 biopolymer transporter ExbD [Conchiformibius steedae DSM 2580]
MAFSSNSGDDDTPMADINVTPLVDVMLVLLIVFMITMPVLTHSIPLELPTTSQKADEKPKQDIKPLTIAIDKEGVYRIGAESQDAVDLEAVKSHLKQVAKDKPDTVVAISADKEVPYDFVAQVLDAAREAKLGKIGFVTKVEQEKAQ